MKINADIRAAVRAACEIQKRRNNYVERRAIEKAAIEALFLRRPSIRKLLGACLREIKKAEAQLRSANELIAVYGLERRYHTQEAGLGWSIADDKKFAKAGGRFRYDEQVKWTFSQAMAELAAAKTEKEMIALLKKFGINWC